MLKVIRWTLIIYLPARCDLVRYLRGHSPPITAMQVRIVFTRYELDSIGKKGAPRITELAALACTTCGLVGSRNCPGHGRGR
jgi:hypothetical protein